MRERTEEDERGREKTARDRGIQRERRLSEGGNERQSEGSRTGEKDRTDRHRQAGRQTDAQRRT